MNTPTNDRHAQAEMPLGRHCALVQCGQNVKRGEVIATASVPGLGNIHAPFPGRILHVDPYRIRIGREAGESVDPVSIVGLNGPDLRNRLAGLGADLPADSVVDTLVINAVDAEPSLVGRKQLLSGHAETLQAGIEALIRAYLPGSTILALPAGPPHGLKGVDVAIVSDQYPAGLDPLVVKAATGEESPEHTIVVGLETVHHVGRIVETGLPVMETMVTVDGAARVIPLGTSVGSLIEKDAPLKDGDRIILGGVLRGAAAASPGQGVDRTTLAVAVVANPGPVAVDAPCVGCGECVRRCPARLDPAMITGYAEFGMYDKAAAEHVEACFECGLCGYFCIARRPMLQYIRLAKAELARAAAPIGEEN
ncbi:MAG: 4Fe-4S dicluster domain-containing protein [Pseudodesulfovibrio sp.]